MVDVEAMRSVVDVVQFGPLDDSMSTNETGDWVKAMRSTIHLYDALARLPRR